MDERQGPDGQSLFIERDETATGMDDAFYVVYTDAEKTTRWGFWCAACESFEIAVDAMGRIDCTNCSNFHKADEWDAAHE